MDNILRVGVIGLGYISAVHLKGYQRCPNVRLTAFCDLIPERADAARRQYGVPEAEIYTDYREMLANESLDAVSICTENNQHAPIALAALASGAHVFCEKPMAITSAEADAMVAAAERYHRKLSVGYQLRFSSHAGELHERIARGELGQIYYAEAKAMRRRGVPTWGVFLNRAKQGGGPLIDIGTHLVDFTLWLMNDYSPVVSALGNLDDRLIPLGGYNDGGPWDIKHFEVEDGAFGLVTLESGATLLINATWAVNMKEKGRDGAILYGVKGGAELMDGQLTLNGEQHGHLWESVSKPEKDRSGLSEYDKEIMAWVDCLLQDKEPMVKAREAAQVVRILEMLYQSARSGGRAMTAK